MAGVARARAVVVTIPDPAASRKVVRICRSRSADARIIVRTRYIREVEELRAAGADEVIPEEFETSIEIVARVLRSLHVPGNLVATQVRVLRDEAYRRLRDPQARPEAGRRLSALMAAGTSDLVLVLPEMAAVGRTLADLHLEEDHVAVPALLRDGVPLAPPPLDLPIEAGDTLLLVGAHEDLVHATKRVEG
jgi:CPA2 family monovalent cation:H+ antiporter-2